MSDLLQFRGNRTYTLWNCCVRGWLLWNLTYFLINSILMWFRLHNTEKRILSISARAEAFSCSSYWGAETFLSRVVLSTREGHRWRQQATCCTWRQWEICKPFAEGHLFPGRFKQNRLVPANLTTGHCFPAETDSQKFIRNQFSGEIIILLCILDRTAGLNSLWA